MKILIAAKAQPGFAEFLKATAAERGVTVSAYMRRAILERLAREEEQVQEQR